jgi:hypothetical protein
MYEANWIMGHSGLNFVYMVHVHYIIYSRFMSLLYRVILLDCARSVYTHSVHVCHVNVIVDLY